MFSPVHLATGMLLVKYLPDPSMAITASVASHYVLDMIPHGDGGVYYNHSQRGITAIFVLDGIAAILVIAVFLLTHTVTWWMLFGAAAAVAPDVLWGLHRLAMWGRWPLGFFGPPLDRHYRFHLAIHAHPARDIPLLTGVAYQLVLVAVALLFAAES